MMGNEAQYNGRLDSACGVQDAPRITPQHAEQSASPPSSPHQGLPQGGAPTRGQPPRSASEVQRQRLLVDYLLYAATQDMQEQPVAGITSAGAACQKPDSSHAGDPMHPRDQLAEAFLSMPCFQLGAACSNVQPHVSGALTPWRAAGQLSNADLSFTSMVQQDTLTQQMQIPPHTSSPPSPNWADASLDQLFGSPCRSRKPAGCTAYPASLMPALTVDNVYSPDVYGTPQLISSNSVAHAKPQQQLQPQPHPQTDPAWMSISQIQSFAPHDAPAAPLPSINVPPPCLQVQQAISAATTPQQDGDTASESTRAPVVVAVPADYAHRAITTDINIQAHSPTLSRRSTGGVTSTHPDIAAQHLTHHNADMPHHPSVPASVTAHRNMMNVPTTLRPVSPFQHIRTDGTIGVGQTKPSLGREHTTASKDSSQILHYIEPPFPFMNNHPPSSMPNTPFTMPGQMHGGQFALVQPSMPLTTTGSVGMGQNCRMNPNFQSQGAHSWHTAPAPAFRIYGSSGATTPLEMFSATDAHQAQRYMFMNGAPASTGSILTSPDYNFDATPVLTKGRRRTKRSTANTNADLSNSTGKRSLLDVDPEGPQMCLDQLTLDDLSPFKQARTTSGKVDNGAQEMLHNMQVPCHVPAAPAVASPLGNAELLAAGALASFVTGPTPQLSARATTSAATITLEPTADENPGPQNDITSAVPSAPPSPSHILHRTVTLTTTAPSQPVSAPVIGLSSQRTGRGKARAAFGKTQVKVKGNARKRRAAPAAVPTECDRVPAGSVDVHEAADALIAMDEAVAKSPAAADACHTALPMDCDTRCMSTRERTSVKDNDDDNDDDDDGDDDSVTDGSGKGHTKAKHVSHPQVERNRRDAINVLIDQLRTMVPASEHSPLTHYVRGSDRRPKRAVLSESIQCIQRLQACEKALTLQVQALRQHVASLQAQLASDGRSPA